MRYNKVVVFILLSLVLVPSLGLAKKIEFDPASNTGGETLLTSITKLTFLRTDRDPATVTFALINTALGLLGFISMLVIIYGGVMWFRSGDNEEHLTKAKGLITGAVIGLILTLGALSLSVLVFNAVKSTTLTTEQTKEESQP